MRPYLYALPLGLLLPACSTTPLCGDGFRCAATDTLLPSEGTSTATGTDTDDPTDTSGETSTTDEATTTGETTGDPPIVGEPGVHGEACAPDDGPAVEFKIDLAERACDSDWPEDVPLFRIVLFKGVAQLDVGEHPLTGGWGFASYDDGDGTPETSQEGTVVITEVTADGLRGTYEVTLPDTTVLSGAFDSLYCPADVLCG